MKLAHSTPISDSLRRKILRGRFSVGDDCWEWSGAKGRGYGLTWNGEHYVAAHRVVKELMDGTRCVLPTRLLLSTPARRIVLRGTRTLLRTPTSSEEGVGVVSATRLHV